MLNKCVSVICNRAVRLLQRCHFVVSVDLQQLGIWLSICKAVNAAAGFLQPPTTPGIYDGNSECSPLQTKKYI